LSNQPDADGGHGPGHSGKRQPDRAEPEDRLLFALSFQGPNRPFNAFQARSVPILRVIGVCREIALDPADAGFCGWDRYAARSVAMPGPHPQGGRSFCCSVADGVSVFSGADHCADIGANGTNLVEPLL
jgi:hypothetical protein